MNGAYTEREWTEHFSKKYSDFKDALPIEEYFLFHKLCIAEMLRISDLVFWNISIVTGSKEAVFALIGEFNKEIRDIIIWHKGHGKPAMHNGVLNRGYELILCLEADGRLGRAFGKYNFERGQIQDVWAVGRGKHTKGHSACFNPEIPKTIIENFSQPSDIIFDPFMGSGTTAVAAYQLGRKWFGCEISKEYCNMANKRMAEEQNNLFYGVDNG